MRQVLLITAFLFLQHCPIWVAAKRELVVINIKATPEGFEPNIISAEPGKRVKLVVTRSPASSCNTDIRIPDKKIRRKLPRKNSISINLGVMEKGSLRFGCGKEMNEPGIIYVK